MYLLFIDNTSTMHSSPVQYLAEGSVLFEPTTAEISSYIKTNYDDKEK